MDIPCTEFKASQVWLVWFINCYGLSLMENTVLMASICVWGATAQVSPLHKHASKHEYDPSHIRYADQAPIWFDTPECTMMYFKSVRSISVQMIGTKQHCDGVHYWWWQKTSHVCSFQDEDTCKGSLRPGNHCMCVGKALDEWRTGSGLNEDDLGEPTLGSVMPEGPSCAQQLLQSFLCSTAFAAILLIMSRPGSSTSRCTWQSFLLVPRTQCSRLTCQLTDLS